MRFRVIRVLLVLSLALSLSLINSSTAYAQSCTPTTAPCQETTHFSDASMPVGVIPCFGNFDVLLVAQGNGVFHININKAGDFWITSTFEGNATFYKLVGSALVPVATGHVQFWFGDEDNNQNEVQNFTANFNGTMAGTGAAVGFHIEQHRSTTPGGAVTEHSSATCR